MAARFKTEKEAVRAFADSFSDIPTTLIQRAFKDDPEDLELVATRRKRSSCCDDEDATRHAEDDEHDEDFYTCPSCERECEVYAEGPDDWPAMWGTIFSPGDPMDRYWIENNAELVGECGFVVYTSDETEILLAVDGAGYDFYEAHWTPLYRARGFTWHVDHDAKPSKKRAKK